MRLACMLSVLGLGLVGCSGDDTANPVGASDAGPLDATLDAPGDVTAPPLDAPPGDAPPDTTPAPATITVVDADGNAKPGVLVVFDDATGAVVGTATTDANGIATRQVAPDAIVTVLLGSPANSAPLTIVGVQPGDTLVARDPNPVMRTILITSFPPDPPDAAVHYRFRAGFCEGVGDVPPALMWLGPGCRAQGTTAMLVVAEDLAFGPLAGYAAQKGISLDGDAGSADAGSPVALTAPFTTSTATQAVTATNVPAGPGSGSLVLTEIAGGLPFQSAAPFDPSFVDAGSLEHAFSVHTGFADAIQIEARLDSVSGPMTTAIATRGGPTDGGARAIDLASLLPLLSGASIDDGDVMRPVVQWEAVAFDGGPLPNGGSLTATDGVLAAITWSSTTQHGTWTFVAPPTATRVRAPSLPAEAAPFLPDADSGVSYSGKANVAAVEATFLAGYGDLRGKLAGFASLAVTGANVMAIVPPLPVDGTVRVTGTFWTVE